MLLQVAGANARIAKICGEADAAGAQDHPADQAALLAESVA
jgi:hypothetical protein